ncbi:hypothetical protein ACIRQQ_43855 [Streptomyces fuscichromogenes]|uniref:hypothetical protein n=1 Tax=Streptomyces fuscichromogenes TaxID=1324013 RepID=UPI0038291555
MPSAPPTPNIALSAPTTRPSRPDEMAEQSRHIFGLGVVQWLGARQMGHGTGPEAPRFDLFLDVLLRGLPAREPGS